MERLAIGIGGLCIILSLLGAGGDDDEGKEARRKALREEVEKLTGKGEWSRAAAAIRKLRLLTDEEERGPLDDLLLRANGEVEWAKVVKARKSSARPGRQLQMIRRFLEKYGEDETLRRRAEDLRERIRNEVVYIIEDFEKDLENVYGSGTERIDGPGKAKEGKFALRWKNDSLEEEEIRIGSERADWTSFRYLTMWVYAETPGSRLTIDAFADGESYYEAWSTIDWTGWKQIRLPLQGKGSRFRREGDVSWRMILGVRIWKDEGKPIDILVDRIALERDL